MAKLGSEKRPAIVRVQSREKGEEILDLCKRNGWKVVVGVEPDKPEDISDLTNLLNPPQAARAVAGAGRNDPCPCGSGRKFKKCCGR